MTVFKTTFAAVSALALSVLAQNAAAADIEAGKTQFRKCATCHSIKEGEIKIGPSLYGVLQRVPGTLPGFRYSEAMKAFGADGRKWTEERLMEYLESPRQVVPGTRMGFPGLKDPTDRENVIAYLRSLVEE